MRNSLWRTTLVMVVVFSMCAVTLPGCSTSSGFKMPSSDWLSWGKKKPETNSLASKSTGLPAPPSSSAAPNTVPSYAGGAAGTSGYAGAPYRSPTTGGTAAGTASYGTQPGGANYYSNASYGATSGAGSANQAYGQTGASQGFYSPDYRGASAPAGGTGAYARQSAPGGYPTGAGGDAYGSYGQGGYAASGGGTGQQLGQAAPPSPAPYAGAGASNYGANAAYGTSSNSYGQSQAPATAPGYNAPGSYPSSSGYAGAAGSYGGQTYGGSMYGDAGAAGSQAAGQQPLSPAVASGGYRPGSTARNTQFGTSDNLNVPAGESVQPAVFAGGGQGGNSSPLSAPSPAVGNTYPQDGETSGTRTATGGGYPYPSTYQR